jgi:hypothetical protein
LTGAFNAGDGGKDLNPMQQPANIEAAARKKITELKLRPATQT